MKVRFTVPGQPVGKGRPRFSRSGGRPYTPKRTADYEKLVREEYERQCGGLKFEKGIPLDMRVTAYFQIPKSVSKRKKQAMSERRIRPVTKPDLSNVLKAVEDALNGIAYHDDSQLTDVSCRKYYGEEPRVTIIIQEAG